MAVVRIETYLIKPETRDEYMALMKKWEAYIEKNKEECKELKSWKLFCHMMGGSSYGYVEMWELDSLADYERLMHRIMKDKEFQSIISPFFRDCLVPVTYSANILNSVG